MAWARRGIAARWITVLVGVAGAALAARGAYADWPSIGPSTQPQAKSPAKPGADDSSPSLPPSPAWLRTNPGPVLSVEFEGGTVAQYIEALRKSAAPEPVNVVVSDQAAKVRLAPLRLRKVALEIAIQSIEAAAGAESGKWHISRVRMGGPDRDALADESPVFSVIFMAPRQATDPFAASAGPAEESVIQVCSLRELIDPKPGDPPGVPLVQKAETVLTAIKATLELATAEGQRLPELKYHQDSGLLIVRGTPEQTGLVQRALKAMESDVRERRGAAQMVGVASNEIAEVRAQLEKANLIHVKCDAAADRARTALARLTQLAGQGMTTSEEVAKAEAQAQNTEVDTRMALIEVQRLAERLHALQERAGPPQRPGRFEQGHDLSAWGPKGGAAAAALAETLGKVSTAVGKEHAASVKFDDRVGACIVTAEPWGQELARRVLDEFARANGLASDGAPRPDAGRDDRAGAQGGGGKSK